MIHIFNNNYKYLVTDDPNDAVVILDELLILQNADGNTRGKNRTAEGVAIVRRDLEIDRIWKERKIDKKRVRK